MIPSVGDLFPVPRTSKHARHEVKIVAVDLHGEASFDLRTAPTLTVECSPCAQMWFVDLYEAVAATG